MSLIFAAICLMLISCSENSSGVNDSDADIGEGTVNITGAMEAEHQGISWYLGLRTGENGEYANYTVSISDVPPGENQQGTFNFTIRMVGDERPFSLAAGEYNIGELDKGVLSIGSYTNREGDDVMSYSSSPDTDGTFTIQSVSEGNIEISFDFLLETGPTTGTGYISVTGSLFANCFTQQTGGIGC